MPKYDYQCDDCKRTYEVSQRISEAPLTACQYCGGHIRRLIAAAPFILKGGGWYVTDYPSESRKKAMDAEKPSSATSSEAKSDGKSSKSEGKSSTPEGTDTKTSSSSSSSAPPSSSSTPPASSSSS